MLRAIKIRLYPNKEQEQTLNKVLGCYRFVYNHMLALKQKEYDENKVSLGLKELSKYFFGTLRNNEQYPWLKEQNTQIMSQSIRQMLTAYDNFFKQHKGFPKYKSKKDKQSALFTTNAISKKNTFETRHISLTKPLKNLKFRCSELYFKRLQKYNKNIRSATLSKTKSGNFFLSVLVEMEDAEVKKFGRTDKKVGIDLGVKDFVITSDGEVFENRHFFTKQEKKIKKLQRQLCKKQKGSNNRNKQRIRLAKAFEKMTNKKENYIHSVVNELLKHNDVVFMEDLNVGGMVKNHRLARAINEVGFFRFKQVLVDKANNNDKKVVFVDRFYPSSKTCSVCGTKHDRDINAAVNILNEGERILAAA